MIIKKIVRSIFPYTLRHFLASCIPRFYKINTYVLENPKLIDNLVPLKGDFIIREINNEDFDILKNFHSFKGLKSFNQNTLKRIQAPEFVGLAAIEKNTNEIAYLSWVILKSIPYFEEFGIKMQEGDYLVKDIFVVPKYRHKGLSSRMEQERINFCIQRGNCKNIYTQPLARNLKGNEVYIRLGYKKIKTNILLRWYVFNIYRSLSGFLKNPFRRIIK